MSEKGFLDRWSERKAKVAEEAEEAKKPVAEPEAPAEAAPEKTDAEILAELGLKDPDEMEAGDDFSAFMKSVVPARIRTRALRRLWASNPAFNVIDPLIDYGEDYTDAATNVENLQTSYQVGKGIVRKLADALLDDSDSTEKPTESVGLEAQPNQDPHNALEESPPEPDESKPEEMQSEVVSTSNKTVPEPELVPIVKNSRRMRFHFEQDDEKL